MSNVTQEKKAPKPVEHPKYTDMVKAAVTALKERNGTSRQAIEKYIKANYKVGHNCGSHLKLALKRMSEKATLIHTKGVGASGSFKLNKAIKEEKPKKKPVVKKPVVKKPVVKKPVVKKPVDKKPVKKPATKKPATKKPTTPKKATKSPKIPIWLRRQ